MSRFYDALKHASRLVRTPEETAVDPLWEPFGVESVSFSPAPEAVADAGPERVPEQSSPWHAGQEQPDNSPPTAIDTSIQTRVTLDTKARVMPNIADSVIVEHYRRLRTKLLQQHAQNPFRSLLVTSANPQEGKTVTVLNLAFSFSMLPSFRVLVIDGDLRRGSLSKWLGVEQLPGLSNLIEGTAALQDVVFRCDQIPIHFIVNGTSTMSPAELLHSPDFVKYLRNITQQFDLVLVDSPPVNLITDTQLLASQCDAVLVVARAFATRTKAFEKMAQDLSQFRVLGTVLNGGTRANSYRSYGGYY